MFSSIEGGIYGDWQINPGSIRSSSKVKVIILIYNNIISEANKLPSGRRTVCRLHCLPDSFLIVYISRCILSSLSCSVSFVIAPILFVCRSRLAGTYFLNHCSDYLLYIVFKYHCINSIHTKLSGHTTLNGLINKPAPAFSQPDPRSINKVDTLN